MLPSDSDPGAANLEGGKAGADHAAECRHTYVTLMHEAGFSLEEIGDCVGQTSADMTDRYRHLREGHEVRAAAI